MNAVMHKRADEWVGEVRRDPERYQQLRSGLNEAKTGQERLKFLSTFAAQQNAAQNHVGKPPTMMW
ncbi:MAG TPA: hypothetical protein VFK24_08320 [Gammaproteobacteria bacterium]|nr:hypothetical protein [Gammaproteobacteria bacterium]